MMNKMICFVVLVLFISEVAAHDCTRDEEIKAQDVVAVIKTWDDVYSAFKQYRHCDDGSISEGFTGDVVHILSTQWDSFPRLVDIMREDKEFRFFVLHHIDASASTKELTKIVELAKLRCKKDDRQLCKDIQKKAEMGIREINEAIKSE